MNDKHTDSLLALIDATEQLIACHDEPTCPAINVARAAIVNAEAQAPAPSPAEPAAPVNQCDGCAAKMPVVRGIHHSREGLHMGCTADRYDTPAQEPAWLATTRAKSHRCSKRRSTARSPTPGEPGCRIDARRNAESPDIN